MFKKESMADSKTISTLRKKAKQNKTKPPSVTFFSEVEKRRFCLNRVKPLNSPQLELLD